MSFKFEKLIIWQESMDWGEENCQLAESFPKKELYNLTSQMGRVVDSIALNISEGSILQSNPEFSKFLGCSIRSVAEVVTCLYKAKGREYISPDEFQKNYNTGFEIMNMLIAFRKQLK